MQQKKLNKMRLIALWACLSTVACTTAPPDFMACADLLDHGHCATYVTKKKSDLFGDDWKKVRDGAVLLPQEQFVKLKTWFDNYCHQNTCPHGLGDWNGFAKELSR